MPPAPSSSPRPGRPRALDETKRHEVCALISTGFGIPDAADYVGCAPSTIRREARRNPEFNAALRRARLTAELEPLNSMRQFAKKYWRAAAWLLERINTQRFGKQSVIFCKPELLDAFASQIGQIISDETKNIDPDLQCRIGHRLDELVKDTELELLAKLEPVPKPRRGRRLPQFRSDWADLQVAPLDEPVACGPPDNSNDQSACDTPTANPDLRHNCDHIMNQ